MAREAYPNRKRRCALGGKMLQYPQEVKEQAVIDLCSRKEPAKTIAQSYGTTREVLYKWKNQLLAESGDSVMPTADKKRGESSATVEELMDRLAVLKKDVASQEKNRENLQREVYRLHMERDILEAASIIIKKRNGR